MSVAPRTPPHGDRFGRVRVVSLGCRLNRHESERMEALARAEMAGAAVIVNTCAVTEEAVRQSRRAVRRARREMPAAKLIVTGCAAEIDPAGFAGITGVDAVLRNAAKLRPGAFGVASPDAGSETGSAPRSDATAPLPTVRGRCRATVQIQNGCDHACTFCVIPRGRGPARSFAPNRIIAEIEQLSARGHPEIVLTGVDLTSWGADLTGTPTLGDLVGRILRAVPDLRSLRLSSVDVAEIDPVLESLLVTERRLAPHLHLSLQSGDDLILKRMRRRHRAEQAVALCRRLRARRPAFAFGADLIAGFPTETDAAFVNTLDNVRACGLDYLHVFPYSPRPGTPAARMPQVPTATIRARAARLRAEGRRALIRRLARHVGRIRSAIPESGGRARLADFCPVAVRGTRTDAALAAPLRLRLLGHDGECLFGVRA